MATIDQFSTMKPLEQMFYIFVQIIFNNFQTKIVFKEVSLDLFANDEFYIKFGNMTLQFPTWL
jgi:hypothetical protein